MLIPVTSSGLLLTTTDTRMQKPNHLAHDPTIELAWWILDSAIQLRITGKAYSVSSDPESAARAIKELDVQGAEEGENKWWQDKRDELWSQLSGHLRGSFGRPPPGTPLDQVKEKPEDWIQRLDVESVCFVQSPPLLQIVSWSCYSRQSCHRVIY